MKNGMKKQKASPYICAFCGEDSYTEYVQSKVDKEIYFESCINDNCVGLSWSHYSYYEDVVCDANGCPCNVNSFVWDEEWRKEYIAS